MLNYTNQLFETLIKNNIYSLFRDKICDAYLADIQLISKFNKGFRFLLSFIDFYRKYAGFVTLKVMKDITITKFIQKNLDETNHKPKNLSK